MNACPKHPCSAYAQTTPPECAGGVACFVSQAKLTNLVLLVDVPEDNAFAPGQTYAAVLDGSFLAAPNLPPPVPVQNNFVATPADAVAVGWNLGNPGQPTALPTRVTFRRLWSIGGAAPVEASTIGLPILPFAADSVASPSNDPGPFQGPSLDFQGALAPGLYERTIMPDPPLDQAFPPDVAQVLVQTSVAFGIPLTLDKTNEISQAGASQYPAFCISSWNGDVNGWTAYLRDTKTKRRISNLRTLTGSPSCSSQPVVTVPLMTDHHPLGSPPDALHDAELVLSPPPGQPVPSYVQTEQGGMFANTVIYPQLPPPTSVHGAITSGGTPVAANLVFEATGIADVMGTLNTFNFEYTAQTSTTTDASGDDPYEIELPPGEYRVTIRPVDLSAEVSVLPSVLVPAASSSTQSFDIHPQQPVTGLAKLTDGRLLVGAIVDAVPTGCSGAVTSSWCLPRAPAPTMTAADGTFALDLDEGVYFLRVRAAEGTNLPWVVQPLQVTPGGTQLTITVPAPFYAPLSLTLENSPVIHALVRVYDTSYVSPQSPAAEVFRSITDTTGHFDLYLAPPTP